MLTVRDSHFVLISSRMLFRYKRTRQHVHVARQAGCIHWPHAMETLSLQGSNFNLSCVQNFKSDLSVVSDASWFRSARSRKKTASGRKNRDFRCWLFFGKQANEKACVSIEHSVRKHSHMRADELSMQKTHAGWPWRSPLQWRPRAAPFASSSFLSHHHRRRALFAFFSLSFAFIFFLALHQRVGFELCDYYATRPPGRWCIWKVVVALLDAASVANNANRLRWAVFQFAAAVAFWCWRRKLNFKLPQSEIEIRCAGNWRLSARNLKIFCCILRGVCIMKGHGLIMMRFRSGTFTPWKSSTPREKRKSVSQQQQQ